MNIKIIVIIIVNIIILTVFPVSSETTREIASYSINYCNKEIISLIQQLDVSIFLGYLENLTSFGSRVTGTSACDDAGRYIYNEFKKLSLDVRYVNWSIDNLSGSNIEATLYGDDKLNDEIYIVCGHYDSGPGSPGADDNGAGTSAVLSTAEVMSKYNFNHTVRFVTFSGEEQGLYGSQYYVDEAVENNDNIIAVLNADMIGYSTTNEGASKVKVFNNDPSKWITDFTGLVSRQYHDYIDIEVIPIGPGGGSDHISFWVGGYDAIFYFEYEWNPNVHSSQDIIENMNPDYGTKVSKLILATLSELSQFIDIDAPYAPSTPNGPIKGKPNVQHSYTSHTTDPNDDKIYYIFDWGDGTDSGWIGPYDSGKMVNATHIWTQNNNYYIRVKAKDTYGHESPWSDPLYISIPKNKSYIIFNWLQSFLENHPVLFQIFQYFLRP